MTQALSDFKKLMDAEEYFQFFQLPFDEQIVNVNRLHILKKFSQLVAKIDAAFPDIEPEEKLNQYREALQQAYSVFLTSTAVEQKLFKVFNEKPKNVVLLSEIESD
ncbi:nitrogenase-stabilizing/protective protein NifW [Planktothrix sp. FACHB-1365]|uniref:nitrogenase-stabilizing/protective protein NifW n=1 Tax=Planktothrix sp. FACHB-1365 TaxID=2692855 RepID=UPI0016846991|nr:nitrogenase-stabilizing/protective protein NifW [Planktothrix sp. FACHB-1365]MBD2484718.1 nitrogenase-stabilizing/protective protein NifW [Planktothrix sp. FACHB-1365]